MMNLNILFRHVVSSLFVMLNQKPYIEFLVVLVTLLFLAMFIMDIFRRYIHNATMKAIFSLLDAVSDSIVIYLLGAMQTASFKNQLFPVWALVLVSFRYSVDFISGYGVPDHGGRRFTEYRNVVKLLGSAFLNWSRGSRFARPLWSLWALQILRSWYRLCARDLAFNSAWHGMSSELITEHMRNWKPGECDPKTMEGYRYLVYGETNRGIELKKPRYVLYIDDTSRRSVLITLDKIWGCCRHLLHHDNSQGKDLKDLSLAFALSRLLRCRLEDMALKGDVFRINRELVKARIVEEPDARRALRILELQLAFLDDYFNTRYPMVFWGGLSSLCLSLLLSVVTFGIVCWLAVDIRKVYKPPEGELAHVVQGFNVDMIITWVFMFFMMFKEIWEMVTYLLSDWTRLLLVCRYAQRKDERTRDRCMESVILSFFKCKILARRWHGHIDQYVFLESYDDRPKFWNLLHKLTTGMVPKKEDGAKLSSAIDVPEYVMPAILEKLRAILGKPADPDISSLPKDISSLPKDGERWKLYGWACFHLPTCSHIILVWHIATCLCEMNLAKKHGVDLSNPGLLCSLLSCFTNCCSSKPYLMNEKKLQLPGELQKRFIIANSLSRYCAYLLVSKSDLIPDSFLVPNMIFQQTVKDARDDILKDCDSLQSRYDKLMEEAEKAAQEADTVKKNEDTVKMGAMLGRELIDHESEEDRWVILAGVWADLLVHIAPSWNAEAHKKCLESGGEFITHIWALLWLCGIEKSRLWPEEDVPESNAPGAPQDNCAENNNAQHVQEMRQADARPRERAGAGTGRSDMQRAGAQVRNIRNKTGAHDKDRIGSFVIETNNFRRQREKEDKWRFDIEEGSDQEDMVVVEPNALIDRAEQSQRFSETKNAEDAGEGLVSLTSTETAGFKRGDAMSWTDLQKCSRKDTVKSRHDGLELEAIREDGSEDKQGMLTADTVDEEHRSCSANGQGNVVRGMQTLENTCYFNAVLQSLLALDMLRIKMLEQDPPAGSLHLELKKLFKETSGANDTGGTLVAENLFSIMCSRNSDFKHGVMEDSNNVLGSLIDCLNKEQPTMVESLFRGQVAKHVSSKECEHTSVTTQVLDLSLAIPSKKPVSIEDCLDLYATGEVDDWDCMACSAAAGNASSNQKGTTVDDEQTEQLDSGTHQKEQSSHPAEKQTSTPNQDKQKLPMLDGDAHQMEQSHNKHKEEENIYRAATVQFRIRKAPPLLTIQLKRFDYVHPDRSDKLEEHVSFQETLDITKFMDPRYVAKDENKYCLAAVIVHNGPVLFEGHNFAYVRASRIGGQQQESSGTLSWFRASDENVTKVSLEEVLKCQAYILFYERVEQSKVKTSLETHSPTNH